METCKLCLNERTLCKSHIYPEYMYKHCYNDKHSFIEFDARKESYNKKRNKGIYQKLLCKKCEEHIQNYEDYGKLIIYSNIKEYMEVNHKPFNTTNYDYKKFKLFVLSMVWRASVSTEQTFSNVTLGKYEEQLRLAILNNKEFPVNEFPILVYQMHTNDRLSNGVFMQMFPSKSNFDGKTIFQFIADGMFFFVGIGKVTVQAFKQGANVCPGVLRVGYDQLSNLKVFLETFGRIHEQGKFSVYEKMHNK